MARRLRHDPLGRLLELRDRYGPVVRLTNWPVSAFLVSDPDAIADALVGGHRAYAKGAVVRGGNGIRQPLRPLLGDGLLTSSGEAHLRQRRLIQPLFHTLRVSEHCGRFVALAERATAAWHDGQQLDLHAELTELTLAIVAETLFGVGPEDPLVWAVRAAVGEILPASPRRMAGRALAGAGRPRLPAARRRQARIDALDGEVYRLIAERRAVGTGGSDVLSLLLAAEDTATGGRTGDTQIRDEAVTLLLAGHETTANALAWAFHLLGQESAIAARLYEEIDTVLGDRLPGITDLPRLTYTRAVLTESMRLYPPVWAMVRHLEAARPVGGYALPAGSTLLLSQWVVHRDGRWWPEPDRFRPDRWIARPDGAAGGGPGDRPRFAYFPFGGGPRQCIGNSFALTEGVLVLATIARHWLFAPVSGAPVVPEPLITLRPRGGLPVIAHRRHGPPAGLSGTRRVPSPEAPEPTGAGPASGTR
jgi:cytochrome P450